MKKLTSLVLILVLSITLLAACSKAGGSGSGSSETVSVDTLKTIGDVIALNAEETQSAVYDGKVIYAFRVDDTYYRVWANITPEDEQAYWEIDFMDEDYEEQQQKIVAPLQIEETEVLNDQMLTREELDALVGKTGQDLQDAGWTYSGNTLDTMEFWMNYGPFQYTIVFDGKVAEEDYDSFDEERDTKTMTVKSAEFSMLGDATTIETE